MILNAKLSYIGEFFLLYELERMSYVNYTIIATCAMGIEAILAKEVRDLGYECEVENGRVTFRGDARDVAKANMWLRTADRIRLEIGRFRAKTFDELFEGTLQLPWEQFISVDAAFPVSGKSVQSTLFSVPDCQGIVKKAVVERLKRKYRQVTWFEEQGAPVPIEIALRKDMAVLTIDSSGTGLHKRGYRLEQGEAPIKETLAAALVQLTNWFPDKPFVDLFCGSGTIAIEAALIGQNIAPGFNRSFACELWKMFPKSVWEEVRQEADDSADYGKELQIFGSDLDPKMIEIAKANALEAGLYDAIQWKQMRASDFKTTDENGVIVCNPPWGERMGKREVESLYSELGETLKPYETWSVYVLTGDEQFEEHYGKKATKKRKLFNGFIRTDFYQYWGKRPKK